MPTYAYAGNNPIRDTDPKGLFEPQDKATKCPNWDEALDLAQKQAGCGKQKASPACSAALKCDICPMLVDGQGPDAFFKDLGYTKSGKWRAGHTTMVMGFPPSVTSVEFEAILCTFEGDVYVKALAATIVHEASEHASQSHWGNG